jgi:phosphatidate cytidylyltransferase
MEMSSIALGRSPMRWLAVAAAFAFPFFFSLSVLGPDSIQWLWAGLVVAALSMRLALGAPLEHAAGDVMAAVFAAIYGSLAGYLVPLRNLGPTMSWTGSGWVILVCALSWMSDTGAYFAGRFLGRHKLAPDISPSKTWEGFFGGMAAAVGAAFFTKLVALHDLTAVDCVILGVVAGVAGPAGDLAESMIKRSYRVKDSGNLLPGHGGMMDRVDAMVFNALAVYAYYHLACAGRISV